MKKLTLFLLFLASIQASAQQTSFTQTVKGKITDRETQIPLPGATVIVLGTEPLQGAVTDLDGNYIIEKVNIGRLSLQVSFIGYEDVLFNEVNLTTGSELILNVQLIEAINKLNEIVIKPEDVLGEPINDMVSVSAQRLTVESTSRVAAAINDPGRTVQSFAGVSAVDDENNEIVVRGNTPRGMLWRMEGIEIPNPNHFSNGEGASGGGVSALSTQVLDDSDFYTGAFSAEYGNALSSVFDLRLREGNHDKREYAFQVGVLGLQAALEGPFSKNSEASYLLNYRYSTTSLINNMGFAIGDSDIFPEWQDISMYINLPTKKMGRFNLWGLGGISSAADLAETDTSKWENRSDAYNAMEKQNLGIIGLSHNYIFSNNKTYLRTVAAYSHTDYIDQEDSIDYNLVKATTKDETFKYNTLTLSSFVNHKFNAQNSIRTGLIYNYQQYDLKASNFDYDLQQLENQIDQVGNTNRFQAYFQWKYRFGPAIDLNTGVHYTYLAVNNDYAIEPRIGLRWRQSEAHTFSLGLGLHSSAEPASIYEAQQDLPDGSIMQPNLDLKMTRAFHSVVGYDWNFAANFHFRAELYYQYLYSVPVQLNDTTGTASALNFSSGFTNQDFANEGTGQNYGLELTLDKTFSDGYYAMATVSLFESTYVMPDGIERNTLYNSKYIYNLIAGKEWAMGRSKQNLLGLNFRGMLRGGYRTTPIDLDTSQAAGHDVRDWDQAYETKAPDYFRIDAGISFRKNKPNWSWIVSLDVQNLTGRLNVYDQYYNAEQGNIQEIYMTGMLPILNYKVEF